MESQKVQQHVQQLALIRLCGGAVVVTILRIVFHDGFDNQRQVFDCRATRNGGPVPQQAERRLLVEFLQLLQPVVGAAMQNGPQVGEVQKRLGKQIVSIVFDECDQSRQASGLRTRSRTSAAGCGYVRASWFNTASLSFSRWPISAASSVRSCSSRVESVARDQSDHRSWQPVSNSSSNWVTAPRPAGTLCSHPTGGLQQLPRVGQQTAAG